MQHRAHQRPQVSMEVLGLDHHHLQTRALRNILSTELAEITYAQLFDGFPTLDTAYSKRAYWMYDGHPLHDHPKLCEGSLERARVFRDNFNPAVLLFDSLVSSLGRNVANFFWIFPFWRFWRVLGRPPRERYRVHVETNSARQCSVCHCYIYFASPTLSPWVGYMW
ncbi:hypothetical protein C7999DRAFT_17550 [Corynascus novoguineensis]|uniref:Uncharacterized protein n=1 Tax=Corynascus novoguineensis TaxID=1126955 RepID=A0AAN7CLA3_9PEZI|nr:hypothetical protein C7999DRAFT_17550 [Corynascus novoguineensis]